MLDQLRAVVQGAAKALFGVDVAPELSRPEEQFGDWATNVALQLTGQLHKNPREVAEALASKLRESLAEQVSDITIAGPGFINFKLSDQILLKLTQQKPAQTLASQTVVAEYSDPNPFKELHAGHLYTSVVGDAIASLLEHAGATVHRVNFGGDIGLHVARAMYVILQRLGGEKPDKLAEIDESQRSVWLAECYVQGTTAYENDEAAKAAIVELNKKLYQVIADGDHSSPFAHIYWTCRQWSYDYFDKFYARIGTTFEKYYPESETTPLGLATVHEQREKGVYEQSDGAIIFNGEKYGLHTRVFINSQGLPTYEAKDVGLIMAKWRDYHFDLSVVITGNDIIEYMKVVLKSIEQFAPELAQRTRHVTHGQVKLEGGTKMSSRKGNVLRAVDVLDAANRANQVLTGQDNEQTVLAAVKYAFLKYRVGGDIIYDPAESVSLEGNSGPYLQYAHARARSILAKSEPPESSLSSQSLEPGERSLVRKLGEYTEVIDKAITELMPHHICTYLYELAQTFNGFYEHNRVLGNERQELRLQLVELYANTLKAGLTVLNIPAPERM